MTRDDDELGDAYDAAVALAERAPGYTTWDHGDGTMEEGLRAVYELGRKDALAWTPTTEDRRPGLNSNIALIAKSYNGMYVDLDAIEYDQHESPWLWNNDDEHDTSVTHFIQLPPLPSEAEQDTVRARLKVERAEAEIRWRQEYERKKLIDKEAKIRGIR